MLPTAKFALALSTLVLRRIFAADYDLQTAIELPQPHLNACNQLAEDFPDQVAWPSNLSYVRAQSTYWSAQQSDQKPWCRFSPVSAHDVQQALTCMISYNTSFAVASGGHSSNIGASNIEHGITIDLSRLAKVTLVDDNSAAWIGPGARWRDVYSTLEPYDLVVSGGRIAHVGAGGYILGGGFSWFANERGWTCDSVLEFEVVVPNGNIVNASKHKHSDLFWALKGSLGAFGIITNIKVPTIKGTTVYAGAIAYSESSVPRLLVALEELTDRADGDLNTQGYISFGWLEKYGTLSISAYLLNTQGDDTSTTFRTFVDIPNRFVGLRTTTLGESAEELDDSNPLGLRRLRFTLTTACGLGTMQRVYDVLKQVIGDIDFEPESLLGATFQPLTVPHLQAQSNIFDLLPQDGPLLLMSFELWWIKSERDEYYEQRMKTMYDVLMADLTQRDVLHRFVYPNYAATWQDPFGSLHDGVRQVIKAVKRRYDPADVWSHLVPGLWHV